MISSLLWEKCPARSAEGPLGLAGIGKELRTPIFVRHSGRSFNMDFKLPSPDPSVFEIEPNT